jgi:hypothetical protein
MRYEYFWSDRCLISDASTIEDIIRSLEGAIDLLRAMKKRGVTLDRDSCVCNGCALLVTHDPAVAAEFGFEEPAEDEDYEDEDIHEQLLAAAREVGKE